MLSMDNSSELVQRFALKSIDKEHAFRIITKFNARLVFYAYFLMK